MSTPTRICLYTPGESRAGGRSSAWLRAVAEVLHAGPSVEVTIPQLAPDRNDSAADSLRRLPRVRLVNPPGRRRNSPSGDPEPGEVLDVIEGLDRERRFDHILVRSFPYCRAATGRTSLAPRVWSVDVLEPEGDIEDQALLADLAAIAEASAWVVVQSEELRAVFETLVPPGRGRTIVLPPAVPSALAGTPRAVAPRRDRVIHVGRVESDVARLLQELLGELRRDRPALELHVLGDTDAPAAASRIGEGGIGLCLWEHPPGSRWNEIVLAPALLDCGAAGVPVVASRTAAHERVLGADYPLFVREPGDVVPVVRSVLDDAGLHDRAARLTIAAAERHAYPRVHAELAPFIEGRATADLHTYDRPKLPGARFNLGMLDPVDEEMAQAFGLLGDLRRSGGPWRLQVGRAAGAPPESGLDPATATLRRPPDRLRDAVTTRSVVDERSWWRTIGIALVRSAGSPHTARARASGAVTFDLEHVTLRAIRELADEATWRRASDQARASVLSSHRPEAA